MYKPARARVINKADFAFLTCVGLIGVTSIQLKEVTPT
jgi:hypothetical protein